MNHFSLDLPPSDTLFYPSAMDTHPNSSFPFFYSSSLSLSSRHPLPLDDDSDHSSSNNLNDAAAARSDTTSSSAADRRDPMFEKPLTPSDVGKLNRLVIPKQHAEKYFPLSAASPSPADGGSGGVLLGFEDECGKCWRFRYSYWNSSQSYVLTKGWSRYVKEKKLDAGDVVLFERHRFEPDRFFIGWRRRGAMTHPPPNSRVEFVGWSGGDQRSASSYNALVHQGYAAPQPHRSNAASFPYLPADSFQAGTEVRQESQKPARSGGVNPKRLRLFGVNLECQLQNDDEDTEPQTSDGSSLSSHSLTLGPLLPISVQGLGSTVGPIGYNYFEYMGYPPNHHNHMDMNLRNGL